MPAQQEASPALLPSTPALLPSTSSAGAFTPEASCGDEGCWPSMYLVGAQKASTTALFQLLRTSSGICGAKARPGSFPAASYKEVHFFDNDGVPWEGAEGARANASLYTRLFRREECASRRFLDATPQYQYSWHAPMRMRLFVPETWRSRVRMITILREPLSRDLSYYNHRVDENLQRSNWTLGWYDGLVPVQKFCLAPTVHRGRPRLPRYEDEVRCEAERWNGCLESAGVGRPLREQYEHCMAAGRYHGSIVRGVYAMHLARWKRYFSRQQILVLQYEELHADLPGHLARIGSFWGLVTLPAVGAMAESNAHEGGHKLRQIDCHTRSMLLALFRPWNDMLYEDLGRDAAAHVAPDVEPRRFRPFDATVGCTDRKVSARGVIRVDPSLM